MEATGRDGGRGRGPWSYRDREQTGISSSTSGTVSTGYTSNGSHLSWISMEAARHFQEMEEEDAHELEFAQPANKKQHTEVARLKEMSIKTAEEMKMEEIKSLAKEFFGSIEGADMSVIDKWFQKLGVGWVLHVAADGKIEQALDVSSWIQALTEISDAYTASSFFPGHDSAIFMEDSEDQFQVAIFIQQSMSKMLAFVDFIDAPNLNFTCDDPNIHLVAPPYQKLYTMLRVRNALFIDLPPYPLPSTQVGRIQKEVDTLLSAKKRKASEAIWNTMKEIMNGILESVGAADDSSTTQNPQDSSHIHKATKSVISYITVLRPHYLLVNQIVFEAADRLSNYAPWIIRVPSLHLLIAKMISLVQAKLADKSEALFPDQGLKFLFLLNNSSFMLEGLHHYYNIPEFYKEDLARKVNGYMVSYIQASWAPVLACLFNPIPRCLFGKNNSPLAKFESEFHKTYTTHKLWKVPDPRLKKTLREAIIKKIIPSYKEHIEEHMLLASLTPRNMEEMLQELFEG